MLKILSFLISVNILLCFSQDKQNESILTELYNFFVSHTDPTISYTEQYTMCEKAITKYISTSNYTYLWNMFDYSGKTYGELGQEDECTYQNYVYLLLKYDLLIDQLSKNSDDGKIIKYLNKTNYYTGFCIITDCVDYLAILVNSTLDYPMTSYLEENLGINNFEVFLDYDYNFTTIEKKLKTSKLEDTIFAVLSGISIVFISIMVFASIMKIILFFSFQITKKKIKNKNNQVAIIRGSSEEDLYSSSSYSKRNESELNNSLADGLLFGKKTLSKEMLTKSQKTKLYLMHIFSKFDLVFNFKCLFTLKNKYYNDTGIELFGFVRLIIMLFLVFNHNLYSMIDMPGKDQYNESFYTSPLTIVIRISTFATTSWVILDGASMSYKAMNYYKKQIFNNIGGKLSILAYFKFIGFTLPKIFVGLYIFYYFYLMNKNFSKSVADLGLLFHYYGENVLNKRACYDKPLSSLIPFWLNYQNYFDRGFTNCYKFVNIFSNELYYVIIVSFLIFLSFKIRSKIYDFSLLFIIIINSSLIFLSYFATDLLGKQISFLFLLNQNYTEKFTHLLINFYFIGCLVGICLFYYNDAVDENSFSQNEEKLPFHFCFWLVSFADVFSSFIKKIILGILVLVLILLSSFLYFRYLSENNYLFNISMFEIFDDMYGKVFFTFILGLILIFLIVYPKDSAFKHLVQTHIFVVFERINVSFFASNDLIIYFSYCVFHFQLKLSYQNLIFTTLGLWFLITLFSILMTMCLEMSMRKGIKYLHSLCRKKKEFDNTTRSNSDINDNKDTPNIIPPEDTETEKDDSSRKKEKKLLEGL